MDGFRARVRATLLTSHHPGYCSGDECELSQSEVVADVDVPQCYLQAARDTGAVPLHPTDVWERLLPEPDLWSGSGYCALSPECEAAGLGKHDFQFRVHAVEAVPFTVEWPDGAPAECVAAWRAGTLTTPHALQLLEWASTHGHAAVLQPLQNRAALTAADARSVMHCLKAAACAGHIGVLQFWKRAYGVTAADVCFQSHGVLACAALENQVEVLKWLQAAYALGAQHLGVLKLESILAEVAARGHTGVLRCLREDFHATDDDIREVIHNFVDGMARHPEDGYTAADHDTLDALLDTLTQTWRE